MKNSSYKNNSIKTDSHIHSALSADSKTTMSQMIEKGISLGLNIMCFTEHMDFNFESDGLLFEVDTNAYFDELSRCRQLYGSQIELLFGIELGLEPHLSDQLRAYVNKWDFDFIIGSSHLVNGSDPYDPTFFAGREEQVGYSEYFKTIPENLSAFSDIDVYGHLDYIVRYGPDKNTFYSYEKYKDLIDACLKSIITHGIGLELNTGGYKYGLGHPNPHPDVLKRYLELGGEIITLGSDAHTPEYLAHEFKTAKDLLSFCGFHYYTIFRGRRPTFIKL